MYIFTKIFQTSGIKEQSYRKSLSDGNLWASELDSKLYWFHKNVSVVNMALTVFENDQVEKLSPFLLRRHVDVPRYGAKKWK